MTIDRTALNNNDADNDVVEFVHLGQRVCRNFTVPLRNRATFDAVMAAALGGNNFDPNAVARTIGPLFDDAMDVEFGAEGSAVLYITIPFFPGQRLGSTTGLGERLSDTERQAYARRVIDWAREMGADEITVQQHPVTNEPVCGEPGEHPYQIRMWWD